MLQCNDMLYRTTTLLAPAMIYIITTINVYIYLRIALLSQEEYYKDIQKRVVIQHIHSASFKVDKASVGYIIQRERVASLSRSEQWYASGSQVEARVKSSEEGLGPYNQFSILTPNTSLASFSSLSIQQEQQHRSRVHAVYSARAAAGRYFVWRPRGCTFWPG